MYRRRIQNLVQSIAEDYDLEVVPVDVRGLAQRMNIKIRESDFDDSLSGFAVQEQGQRYIGVNKNESANRQRFTIAHEIGHLFLHAQDRVNYDAGASVVLLRDGHSSEGTDIKEIEANRFAAELLMPEDYIRADIAKHGPLDLMENDSNTKSFIQRMADKYGVSQQAMSIRLTTLYFN